MKKLVIALLLSIVNCLLSTAQIGTWRNYLAYHDIQQIQATSGDDIFVLASNGLYQYNKADRSITTYDKVNGLSDTYIAQIRWCQQAKRLIAVYSNMNIDLIDTKGNITNISSIYTKAITGDKTINNITINGPYAYLSCGFGIVKVNVQRAEISESYMLGFNVDAVAFDNSYIYAKNGKNVWRAPLSSNLIDKSNWQQTTSYPSFSKDTSDYDQNIDLVKTLQPGGPKYNSNRTLKFINNRLYTCNGNLNGKPATLQRLENNEWTAFGDPTLKSTTGVNYLGIVCVEEDPNDKEHVFAGSRNGLYEFKNGSLYKFYNHKNSPIESVFSPINPEYEFVTALLFDPQNNLWVMNSESQTHCLLRLKTNGEWESFTHPELLKYQGIGLPYLIDMKYDSQGLIWFVHNNWTLPALYCYQPESNAIKAYETPIINQDGTKYDINDGVRCVVEDKDQNIWIGTSSGPFMLERNEITQNGSTFTQVKVPRNDGTNYADYLLTGIDISSIAIDGGNRKWFGTLNNGVYLISADNMTQLQHFTTDNSPLLSNNVQSIAINPTTGEVYFGTEQGLCSYISDATQANEEMNEDNVWAYPNPVNPGYTGPITITGLSYNADVKILSANGALVHEGRSNGGTYTWYGEDQKGRRVASGVYMVVTATKTGEKGTVCKIAVVR